MDDRLEKALDHSNYKATIVQQKENIKVRLNTALLFAKNGGLFTITPALISFVELLVRRGDSEAILIDDRGNPAQIIGLEDFLDEILAIYTEATNEYFTEYEAIRKARNVKTAVGL